jgi:hypothetical protein
MDMNDDPRISETSAVTAEPASRKSAFERLTAIAQGVAILFAVGISGFNAWFYLPDREERELKEVFDNQLAITKLYFEKMASLQSRDWCREAPLFANTSAIIAGMTLSQARARIVQLKAAPQTIGSDFLTGLDRHSGVQALAVMLVDNFDQRLRSKECDTDVVVHEAAGAPGALVHADAPSGLVSTSYALTAAAPAARPRTNPHRVPSQLRWPT